VAGGRAEEDGIQLILEYKREEFRDSVPITQFLNFQVAGGRVEEDDIHLILEYKREELRDFVPITLFLNFQVAVPLMLFSTFRWQEGE
jgi:hypothetical protein